MCILNFTAIWPDTGQTNGQARASIKEKKNYRENANACMVIFLCSWKVDFRRYKRFTWQSQYDRHLFMPELYMKYAGPGRSARWGAALNSDQEPNHWKTPTGLQCRLPGQHEQELSTMAAELQKPTRGARNHRERDTFFTGTKLEKQWTHAGYIIAP